MNIIKNYKSYINEENSNDEIRVSCASFARIKYEDKYLLMLNDNSRKKGKEIYGPIGGGLEFNDEALPFLESISARPEKDNNDLRLRMPISNLQTYKDWFYSEKHREVGVFRELYEELVEEDKLIDNISESDVSEKLYKVSEDEGISQKIGFEGTVTKYMFEIYDVDLSSDLKETLLKIANDDTSSLKLFSKDEILNLPNIGGQTKHII